MDNITIDKANENVKSNKRIEKDKLGKVSIDKDLLYEFKLLVLLKTLI